MLVVRRVVLVALHFAEYSVNLALALSEKVQVLLILYQDNANNELGVDWQQNIRRPGLDVLVIVRPKTPQSIIKNARILVKSIKQFEPDIIHYQEDPRDELILSLLFLAKWPSIMTIHDPTHHTGWDARLTRFTFYQRIIRRTVDAAITHGTVVADELRKVCPRLKNKIWSIAHGPLGAGVNMTTVLQPEGHKLLFFGRIHAYKGIGFFVDAVIALRDKGYPVVGVVAGKGTDLETYRQRMIESGCFEIINRYIGAKEIPELFLTSRIIVLPYTDATQSGVAAMALGFGRPVVASAVGSVPELVKDGINGLLVPPRDSEKLTQALESIIASDALWQKLASGALRLKNSELSWHTIADNTLAAYQSVVQLKYGVNPLAE